MFCRVAERGNFAEYSELLAILLLTVKRLGKPNTYSSRKKERRILWPWVNVQSLGEKENS